MFPVHPCQFAELRGMADAAPFVAHTQVLAAASAGDGARTRKGLLPRDFKSLASADFATPAHRRLSKR